jgi:hypothetical protein
MLRSWQQKCRREGHSAPGTDAAPILMQRETGSKKNAQKRTAIRECKPGKPWKVSV